MTCPSPHLLTREPDKKGALNSGAVRREERYLNRLELCYFLSDRQSRLVQAMN